jgi:hypothetical protein
MACVFVDCNNIWKHYKMGNLICRECNKTFDFNETDVHLKRDMISNEEIMKEYPIQDDTWPSRRWNISKTDHCDLSGGFEVVCGDCHEIECVAEYIQEKAESRGWENAQHFTEEKYGKEKTSQAMFFLSKKRSL